MSSWNEAPRRASVWVGGLLLALAVTLSPHAAAGYERVVTLRWTQPTGIAPTGFAAYLGDATRTYGESRDLGAVAPGSGGVYQAGLVVDVFTTYFVALTSYNGSGASIYSNELVIAAAPCDPAFCEDGSACTTDACGDGACSHVSVPDGTACTGGAGGGLCVAGRCEPVQCLSDVDCGDGNACNGPELCIGGRCQPGPAPSCTGETACTWSTCDASMGCVTNPKPDGTACDDGSSATVADQCRAGACVGSPAPPPAAPAPACDAGTCDDANSCTADACGASGCAHAPVADGTACDDGNPSTVSDQCVAGTCGGTIPVVEIPPPACSGVSCRDGNTCTADACSDGACIHIPVADGVACDDGNRRTRGERCRAGVCRATTWKKWR